MIMRKFQLQYVARYPIAVQTVAAAAAANANNSPDRHDIMIARPKCATSIFFLSQTGVPGTVRTCYGASSFASALLLA